VTSKIRGKERLSSTLAAASRNVANMPPAVHQQAGNIVARSARSKAPTRTGRLRNSISATTTGSGATVTAGVPYARFQNYGTRFVRARRFMDNALDDNVDRVLDVYDREVDKQLDRVKGV
jgi:HK97 gp10 family phage protein